MGNPALLDAQSARLIARHNSMMLMLSALVIGGIVSDGGTTQASGSTGTLNFDIDTTAIPQALIDGQVHALTAQTDADATAGNAVTWGATSGKAVVAAVVLTAGSANDTPAIETVFGSVATTGSQVAPTDDEIDVALGHNNWLRLADVTITRTADTTVTFAANNNVRFPVGVRGAWRSSLAETEAAFRETSPTQA